MSPEQVKGAEADARRDIFAFGALLYEIVTRQKAFTGKNRFTVIGAILDHRSRSPRSRPFVTRRRGESSAPESRRIRRASPLRGGEKGSKARWPCLTCRRSTSATLRAPRKRLVDHDKSQSRTICVWIVSDSSLPDASVTRVSQTCVRRPL